MNQSDQYNSFLSDKIVKENILGINEIKAIESTKSYLFSLELVNKIKDSIASGKPLPKEVSDLSVSIREYLDVFEIVDQAGRTFYVLVYDNDELSQDPTIIEIINFV